jgi:hypothetical protein
LNIKPCMGHISGTWELLLCEYWRKSMIIGDKNLDLKRLTGRLKLCFLTEIGQFHWNQGKEVAHFTWFGEPWYKECTEQRGRFGKIEFWSNVDPLYLVTARQNHLHITSRDLNEEYKEESIHQHCMKNEHPHT